MSSAILWMNGQMKFCRVLGLMAPPEPPTVEQVKPSFRYALMKKRAHMMWLAVPSSGIISCCNKKLQSCYDNCSCAKKLAEGSFLCQQPPDALAAFILDVLVYEDEILWQRLCFMPVFVAVHVIMIEAERAAEGSYHNEDGNGRGWCIPQARAWKSTLAATNGQTVGRMRNTIGGDTRDSTANSYLHMFH